MKPAQYYLSEILKDVIHKVSDISEHVYPENRPLVSDSMADMIVVSFPIQFEDKRVCQDSDIRFEIIVRNRHNNVPNVEKLQEMLNLLVGKFPIVGERYVLSRPFLALKGEDEAGFTIWVVQANIRINTTDRYDLGSNINY